MKISASSLLSKWVQKERTHKKLEQRPPLRPSTDAAFPELCWRLGPHTRILNLNGALASAPFLSYFFPSPYLEEGGGYLMNEAIWQQMSNVVV